MSVRDEKSSAASQAEMRSSSPDPLSEAMRNSSLMPAYRANVPACNGPDEDNLSEGQTPQCRCARPRTFLSNDIPHFALIASEINGIINSVVIHLTRPPYIGFAMHPDEDPAQVQRVEIDYNPSLTGMPFSRSHFFRVIDINIVGSQASPVKSGGYNFGRDLDLIVRIDVPEVNLDLPYSSDLPRPLRDALYKDLDSILYARINPPDLKGIWKLAKGDPEYRYWIDTWVKHRDYKIDEPNGAVEIYPKLSGDGRPAPGSGSQADT